jgi:hypothetical protein
MAVTPDGLLKFVNDFGPMLPEGNQSGEDMLDGISAARSISKTLRSYSNGNLDLSYMDGFGWSRIDVHFAYNTAAGRPYLKYRPASFLHALHLEFGLFLTKDAQVRECLHCGQWFETGPGTERRADAKFCCDEHRILFNSLKRPRVGDTRA